MEERRTAANGIELFTYKNEQQHGFFVSLFLRAGSMYESDDERGITHFLEHVLVRNVNKLKEGALYSTLDEYGVEFNASTYSEMVQFYIAGATKNFFVATDIVRTLMRPLALTADEINTERRRIKAEIRESDDKNSLATLAASTVHEGTSLSGSILGTNKSVDRITAAKLEKYRRRVFIKDNIFLYVTGNFTDSDVTSLLDAVGEFVPDEPLSDADIHRNVAPVSNKFGKRDAAVCVKNADYTVVRFSFDMNMYECPTHVVDLIYDMLLTGFSSPFFIEMSEERGLFYDINGAVERYNNIGVFYFNYEVKEKNLYDAVAQSVKILNSFRNTVYPECKCMKAAYVDNAYMLLDDLRDFNFTFAYDNHIMNVGYSSVDERRRLYDSVTPEEIRRVACKIFTPDNLTLSVKGSKKKIVAERLHEIIKKWENSYEIQKH